MVKRKDALNNPISLGRKHVDIYKWIMSVYDPDVTSIQRAKMVSSNGQNVTNEERRNRLSIYWTDIIGQNHIK